MDRPLSHNRSDLKDIARQAMIDRDLWPDFSGDVEKELGAIPGPAAPAAGGAPDLRGLLWCSIDNDDSLDLDQLSVSEALPGGAVRILIAIADVDALVGKGAAIDEHARHNTTSVYTAAEIFPMLPERLSTDWTSLAAGQDRLAIVIDMTIDPTGDLVRSDVYRASVRNQAKLAYNGVGAWLEGTGPLPDAAAKVPGMDAQLRAQDTERPGTTPIGHFGLAVRDYTHSTAPNRRFPDLITHRLIKAALANQKSPYGID